MSDHNRIALHGAQQALRHVIEPDTWQPASQTFYRIDKRSGVAARSLTAQGDDDRQRGPDVRPIAMAVGQCGLRRSPRQRGAQGDVAGRLSARSCKSLHQIGDRTAQLVAFQFKERVDQARAMGGK